MVRTPVDSKIWTGFSAIIWVGISPKYIHWIETPSMKDFFQVIAILSPEFCCNDDVLENNAIFDHCPYSYSTVGIKIFAAKMSRENREVLLASVEIGLRETSQNLLLWSIITWDICCSSRFAVPNTLIHHDSIKWMLWRQFSMQSDRIENTGLGLWCEFISHEYLVLTTKHEHLACELFPPTVCYWVIWNTSGHRVAICSSLIPDSRNLVLFTIWYQIFRKNIFMFSAFQLFRILKSVELVLNLWRFGIIPRMNHRGGSRIFREVGVISGSRTPKVAEWNEVYEILGQKICVRKRRRTFPHHVPCIHPWNRKPTAVWARDDSTLAVRTFTLCRLPNIISWRVLTATCAPTDPGLSSRKRGLPRARGCLQVGAMFVSLIMPRCAHSPPLDWMVGEAVAH